MKKTQKNPVWDNDFVQFARLLAEINAVQEKVATDELCASMDLTPNDISELLQRADVAWERAKEQLLARGTEKSTENETRPRFTFDVATRYFIEGKGAYNGFADAVEAAEEGDHIHFICGVGDSKNHLHRCHWCNCLIAPVPNEGWHCPGCGGT